jgi:AAA family ATP:ADP antiporter
MPNSKSSYFIIGMILLSLALGIFNSYFFVFVNALFISEIGTSKLPIAYLLSGFGGLLITYLFNSAEKRWGFAKASTVFGLFFALVMLAIWVAYVEGLYLYFLIFFAYAWLWVSSNFTSLVFWKLPSNIFNLEETKKYNGIISSGEGISSIISYLSVPALLTLEFFTRDKFLMISFFGMLSFTVLTFILSRGIKVRPVVKPLEENNTKNAENQKKVSKEPYFRYIFFAVMLAVVIQFLVDFSLMEVSASQMTDPLVLASYFSLLFGGMRIIELILKSFFSKFLVKQYGVFICLSTMIFALGFITIIGISSFFIGYLSILLIVSSLSKVFERSLYRSVYAPTINLLYQAYPIEKRGLTQNYADGFGKTIGQLIAAVLIFIVSTIQTFEYKVLALLILVFAILIIWLFVSRRLIYFYKIELSNILNSLTGPKTRESEVDKELIPKEVVLQANKQQHLGPVEQVMQMIHKFLSIESIHVAGSSNDTSSDFTKKDSENEDSIFVSETENLIETVKSCSAPQLEKILDQLVPLKLSHQRFGRLLQLIELFLQTSLIQKNTSFNFHNSQKNLKVTDFLYTSVIQNLVNKQIQNLENQEYYQLLEDRIQKYTYLLICHKDLGKSYPELDKLILLEINATKNDILFCLSFKHDPLTVNQIVMMINQGDKSQELISLELLELILQEQEKKWVLPIFKENTSDKILVKLENDFAQVLLGNEKRLLSILGAFKLDIPNLIKAKALEDLLLHFPNSLNQELAKTIKKNNLNLNSLAIDLGFEERKVDQGGNSSSLANLTPKPKMDQNTQPEDEISLHYSYWMDANETEQVKNLIYHKMKPIFRTLFPVVFPLEKVT